MDNDTTRVWLDGDRLIVAHRYGGCYGVVTVGNTGIDADEELSELPPGAVELTAAERPPNDYTGGPARTERELQLEHQVAELEEHERERLANAQIQYSQAWNAWVTLLKRIGAAAGVELPGDLRYYKYENQIIAKITDLRAGQPNT